MDTHAQILEDYKTGMAKYKIALKYRMSKQSLQKLINKAIADGELDGTYATIRSDNKRAQNSKMVLESQVRFATVCDLWRKGYTYEEIKEETGMCFETVKKYVTKGIEEDAIYSKDNPERKKLLAERRKQKSSTREYKERKPEDLYKTVPSTLKPGETIKCTFSVSQPCVYGRRNTAEAGCRYSLVTGKCRTIDKATGEHINPKDACTCYSKVSKKNPKLNCVGEERFA